MGSVTMEAGIEAPLETKVHVTQGLSWTLTWSRLVSTNREMNKENVRFIIIYAAAKGEGVVG